VSKLDLPYQILKGEGSGLLTDKDLIETAKWLETQGLVRCTQEKDGIAVQLNFEGIDAWIQGALNKLGVKWFVYKMCAYGITLRDESPIAFMKNEQTILALQYKCLWIQVNEHPRTHFSNDIVVHFADIFCEKLDFSQFVERIASDQDTKFVLKWEKDGLYLNQIQIVTDRSNIRKAIMQILIEYQKNKPSKYISFEGVANVLQERYSFVIDDLHSQIYKQINALQTTVMKKIPQLAQRNDFIEISRNSCRLNASIWAVD
jgi:hypothetical protein